jgi:ATP-binding cassette subfamily B protein
MLKLVKYLKKYRKNVILGPIFKLTEAVFELIVPLVMAKIIDVGIANKDSGYIWKMGGVLVLLGVCGLGFALICQYVASVASQGFGTELRRELYHHINTLSHKEVDEFGTPSLITRLTSDINQLQVAVAMLIRLVVRAPFFGYRFNDNGFYDRCEISADFRTRYSACCNCYVACHNKDYPLLQVDTEKAGQNLANHP